jgi:hypothetical protein
MRTAKSIDHSSRSHMLLSFEIHYSLFGILRFCSSYSLLDKGFHLYIVAIRENSDGPVIVGTVGSCSQGVVPIPDSPGGQMERVVKTDGEYRNSRLKPM